MEHLSQLSLDKLNNEMATDNFLWKVVDGWNGSYKNLKAHPAKLQIIQLMMASHCVPFSTKEGSRTLTSIKL